MRNVSSNLGQLPGLLSEVMYWRLMYFVISLNITVGMFATGANVITIIVYFRMGFADATNISLTALAVSDLGIALTTVGICVIAILPELFSVPFATEIVLPTLAYPHTLLTRVSAFITLFLSIERYLCVLLPLRVKTIITYKRTLAVNISFFGAILVFYVESFIRYPIGWEFDPSQNRTILRVLPLVNEFAIVLDYFHLLIVDAIVPFATFFAILICTILLSLSLQKSKAWRDANNSTQAKTTTSLGQSSQSAVKQSKEMRAVKMVITIATVFIITNIPSCSHTIINVAVPEFDAFGRYHRIFDVIGLLFAGTNSINSGANVIIYYVMSQKFRQAFLGLMCTKQQFEN